MSVIFVFESLTFPLLPEVLSMRFEGGFFWFVTPCASGIPTLHRNITPSSSNRRVGQARSHQMQVAKSHLAAGCSENGQ
jgi:hypothetical protein